MTEENQVANEQPTNQSSGDTVQEQPQVVDWRESLPEDLRSDPSLKDYVDVAGLAKSHVHLNKMVGMDKIPVPNKHATDEDWQVVYDRLGRPKSAADYQVEGIEGIDESYLNSFKEQAHKLGLLPQQVEGVLKYYTDLAQQSQESSVQDLEVYKQQAEQELRKEFGKAYEDKIQKASNIAMDLLGPQTLNEVRLADGRALGDHPDLIKAFVKISDMIGEDKAIGQPRQMSLTPDDAKKRIRDLTADGSPYWNKGHVNHGEAVKEVQDLYEYAYPQETN